MLLPTTQLNELSSFQDLDDSISFGWVESAEASPSSEHLVDDVRHSFGSPGSSFMDMYPAELFTVRGTTAMTSDFDFHLPVVPDGTESPTLLVRASRIFRGGHFLPCEPGGVAQEHGDGVDVVPSMTQWSDSSSLFDTAHNMLRSCTSAMSDAGSKLGWRQRPLCAGRSSSSSPPRKVLPRYLRFLVPLYRKVRALRPRTRVVAPAAPSATLGSTASAIEWCHGNANAAIDDAILYCKKSSVRHAYTRSYIALYVLYNL
jgi:hypothetical protein